ncbi:SDR family oxidoreductase [Desulfovermiculus halophilus]|uniref:SDR family oxidoreductase n=1 Tax=Desulfovermiculus halophilus TaxID=339722 RepID=UPI00048914B8|nr:SDR family oxidoreductase [Desulfovermiculus halophilus]
MPHIDPDGGPILVLGATGYVGGRLVPRLLNLGYTVRAGARSVNKLACRPYSQHPRMQLAAVDVLDQSSLEQALSGCQAAYYLVHSMQAKGGRFQDLDRTAASNMTRAAEKTGLKRIIYLGGLGEDTDDLSEHLRSRHEVGRILHQGPVPVTFLRAAILLGAGSASFELVRYLVDRLPVMTTPRWVFTQSQPIAVSNVLTYLTGCLQVQATTGETFDIGGPDIVSYRELFDIYAQEAGLHKRIIIPVPLLTPKLSAAWIHLVTPVPAGIAKPLIDGLRNRVVCRENRIQELIPQNLLSCRQAIRQALQKIKQQEVDTCWSDAGELTPPEWVTCGDASYAGGTVLECNYTSTLATTPQALWPSIISLGGEKGWGYANILWTLRGLMDRMIGGIGLARGRRTSTDLRVGDALDFWRVLSLEENKRLQLMAEMKLPGEAIMELEIVDLGQDRCELRLITRFLPRGLLGLAYWYGVYPLHGLVFKGMLRSLAKATKATIIRGPQPFDRSREVCTLPDKPPQT